jgi:hypothetical protein
VIARDGDRTDVGDRGERRVGRGGPSFADDDDAALVQGILRERCDMTVAGQLDRLPPREVPRLDLGDDVKPLH